MGRILSRVLGTNAESGPYPIEGTIPDKTTLLNHKQWLSCHLQGRLTAGDWIEGYCITTLPAHTHRGCFLVGVVAVTVCIPGIPAGILAGRALPPTNSPIQRI